MENAKMIIDLFSEPMVKFETDDHITIYYTNITVTIDFDEQWCRIHQLWVLQKAINLEPYWHDPKQCYEIILSEIQSI